MNLDKLRELIDSVKFGQVSTDDALQRLRSLPFEDVESFACLDTHRAVRTGAPEAVYCPGKTNEQLGQIAERLSSQGGRVLATRATREQYDAVRAMVPLAVYHDEAKLIAIGAKSNPDHPERYVGVLTAGTVDIPVAEEAALTLEFYGSRVERCYDVGVAGLHRLLDKLETIQKARSIVVCAGMDGALASVVGGLVACPVVAVPTSAGYGASFGGFAALLAMLNSCAGGVAVMNIDNGFGAGVYAHRINSI